MRIGVVGAGRVGSALAKRLAPAHEVWIGSRDPARAKALAQEIGAAGGGGYREAAEWAEVILFTVPWWGVDEALAGIGDVGGKVLVDTVNPYTDESYTQMVEFTGTSAAEEIQKRLPGVRVVQAWNHIHAQVMDSSPDFGGVPATCFVCGDDQAAKEVVSGLAREIGYAPVDAGPLSSARYLEPLAGLKVRLSYELGMGTEQAINLIER